MAQITTLLLDHISDFHFAQQVLVPAPDTADVVPGVSGFQFFMSLVAGLVLAFGFQLLLTNLSVATGISLVGSLGHDSEESEENDSGMSVSTVGLAVGIWTLITVSLVLFVACYLAVKLGFVANSLQAITMGLVIWATYFSLLVWMSATSVGSLMGSVVSTATVGFQTVFGAAIAPLKLRSQNKQLAEAATATIGAIRQEVMDEIDSDDVRESLQDYLTRFQSPSLNFQEIEDGLEQMLRKDASLLESATPETLAQVDRSTFEDLVRDRTDLSPRDAKRVVERLEKVWRRTVQGLPRRSGLSELAEFLRSAQPQQLLSDDLGDRLDQLIGELRKRRQDQTPSPIMQAISPLMGIVMGRTDLSDLDIERIERQLKDAQAQVVDQAHKVANYWQDKTESSSYSPIRADVEHYVLHAHFWQLTPERIDDEFRNILYDSEANLRLIRQQVEAMNRGLFSDLLRSRGLFTQAKIQEVSLALETTRQQVLKDIIAAEEEQASKDLKAKVETYLHYTPKEELLSAMNQRAFRALIEDPDVTAECLQKRLQYYDHNTLATLLSARNDLSSSEQNLVLQDLETALREAAADAEGLTAAATARVETQWQNLQNYLRNTGKPELNPEGIQRDLKTLMADPQTGLQDLQLRLQQFDRDTLVQLLSQRRDLTETDINELLEQVERSWYQAQSTPRQLVGTAQAKYQATMDAIATYLRETGKAELNPEGIQRDLETLLSDPQAGLEAFGDRLAQVDRDTFVQLLSQRDDLSEAEVNDIINQVQTALHQIVKAPRRLALRAKAQVQNFQSGFADYLRSTDKAELNPEGIQRDLKLLVNDPQLGFEKLGDRLQHIDRTTVIALLSQRDDLSEAEATQIVDQVLAVRDQLAAQFNAITRKIQAALDTVLDKIRAYLNGLERDELN